ncbi:hypothetical protein DFH07DRAFT_833161 [Mycena maculata]|uniref:Uncharacterized protein n=1 Tax=Mycena maculata TaxID=230809 RepID=A0AAD7ILJ2_9AGAR|nr:hypothetical protein DFH07DRAFT_833161 [Mycena maculata]
MQAGWRDWRWGWGWGWTTSGADDGPRGQARRGVPGRDALLARLTVIHGIVAVLGQQQQQLALWKRGRTRAGGEQCEQYAEERAVNAAEDEGGVGRIASLLYLLKRLANARQLFRRNALAPQASSAYERAVMRPSMRKRKRMSLFGRRRLSVKHGGSAWHFLLARWLVADKVRP